MRKAFQHKVTAAFSIALLVGFFGANVVLGNTNDEPVRREKLLIGLEDMEAVASPEEWWHTEALSVLERLRMSTVAISEGEIPGSSPLTGFVISSRHVLTAHLKSLPEGDERLFQVRTFPGKVFNGRQIAGWSEWDFGVIEVDQDLEVPALTFGDEKLMKQGDPVFVVQNPNIQIRTGLFITTMGFFSFASKGFCWAEISTTFGGSGAAIVNLRGEVVGMSTMGSNDPKYAIPVRDIEDLFVSELRLRNSLPVDRGGSVGGVGGQRMSVLTDLYRVK